MHKYQNLILKKLLYIKGARFSELNNLRITSDRFNFHLKRLIEKCLVVKKDNLYYLSPHGKELASRIERQAKLGIALNIIKDSKNGRSYLIQKRGKEPLINWSGTPSGKIKFGENPIDSAKRILTKETGLMGDILLKGTAHYIRTLVGGEVVDDEYFLVFVVTNTKGKLLKHSKEGDNFWVGEKEFKKLKKVFTTYPEMEKFTNSEKLLYLDIKKPTKDY